MKLDDFPKINLSEAGTYRLVREDQLTTLLANNSATLFAAMKKGPWRYGDILKIFRETRGLTQEELATKIKVERKTIWSLEKGSTAFPQENTHDELITLFGSSFELILKQLKIF